MEHPVAYHQSCPICGRNLRIGVTLLGKRVYCQHCGGGFIASDASSGRGPTRTNPLATPSLDVVDALIEKADAVLGRAPMPETR